MRLVDGHSRYNVFSFQTEIHKSDKRKSMPHMMHSTKGREEGFQNRSKSRMVLAIGNATIHRPVLHPCRMKKSFARALEHSTINTVNRAFTTPTRRAYGFMGFKKSYDLGDKERHISTIVFPDCVSESTDCLEGSDSKRPDSTKSQRHYSYATTSGTKHENPPKRNAENSENLDKHMKPKIVNLRPWENDKLKSSKRTVFRSQDTERERNIAYLMSWLIECIAKQQEDDLRTQSGQNNNECGDQDLRTDEAILSSAGAMRCVNSADRNWLSGVLLISSNIASNSQNLVQFLPKIMQRSLHLKNGPIAEGKLSGHTLPLLKKDNKICLKNHRRTNHKPSKQHRENEEDSDQLVRLKNRLHERDLLEKELGNKYKVLSHTNEQTSTESEKPNIRDSEQSSLPKLYLFHHSFATGNRSKRKDKKCFDNRRTSGTCSWAKRVEQNKEKYHYPKKSNECKRSVICRTPKESTLSAVNYEFSQRRKEDQDYPSRIVFSPLRGFTRQLSEFSDNFRL